MVDARITDVLYLIRFFIFFCPEYCYQCFFVRLMIRTIESQIVVVLIMILGGNKKPDTDKLGNIFLS